MLGGISVDEWVHPENATISINDIAVLRGYSVFESFELMIAVLSILMNILTRLYRSARAD